MKFQVALTLFAACLSLLTSRAGATDKLAMQLLEASDRARGAVKGGLTWHSKVTTNEDGANSEREFIIKAKGNDAYVEATQPARTKGEVFIFNDRNMWFFKPSLKRPVSISPRQKLSGQAANGDIASTRYSRDYEPTIEKTEVLNGEKTHVLLLKAKANNLTYDQIRYWVSDTKQLAMKAEFLTLQGQAFKVATMVYGNSLKTGANTTPFISKLTITDARFSKNQSIIEYSALKIEDHPASLFSVGNLAR